MRREVGASLEVEITAPTTLEFQIAVAPHPNTEVYESLSFDLDGAGVQPMEISGTHGNRIHKLDVPVGNLRVEYSATIVGRTDPAPVTEYDLSMYLRPSRYAEADKFFGFAATEFGQYVDSARLFSDFLQAYPSGAYAPNALYWLGESYYVTQNYQLAQVQFQSLYDRYPTHDKAPGAMLKIGLAQFGLKQVDAAERTLADVAARYPGTDAARTASDRLNAIQLSRLRN